MTSGREPQNRNYRSQPLHKMIFKAQDFHWQPWRVTLQQFGKRREHDHDRIIVGENSKVALTGRGVEFSGWPFSAARSRVSAVLAAGRLRFSRRAAAETCASDSSASSNFKRFRSKALISATWTLLIENIDLKDNIPLPNYETNKAG
jgi:hypothetical protein